MVYQGKQLVRLVACLLCLLLLMGCEQGQEATVTPAPVEAVAEVTPEPEPQNPVRAFWDAFMARVGPVRGALEAYAEENVKGIAYTLALDLEVQRLQKFFLGLGSLMPSGEEHWEGALIGALDGSGTISGAEGEAVFSVSFQDGTRLDGSIAGDEMQAVWKYSEIVIPEQQETEEPPERDPEPVMKWHEYRSARIRLANGVTCEATLWWDDGYSRLVIDGKALHLAQECGAPVADGLPPAQWADWSFAGGAVQAHVRVSQGEESLEENPEEVGSKPEEEGLEEQLEEMKNEA